MHFLCIGSPPETPASSVVDRCAVLAQRRSAACKVAHLAKIGDPAANFTSS
jgi:hypothetical protein